MTTIAGILAFLQAIPKILDLMSRMGVWMQKNGLNKWLDDLEGSIDQLEKAQTAQEKLDAAKRLADSIRHLG